MPSQELRHFRGFGWLVMLVAGGIVLAACVPGIVLSTMGRPGPSEPATGPVISKIEVSDTTFTMHDEGDGCLAVDIDRPGLQQTVERRCFDEWNALGETQGWGWLAEPSTGRSTRDGYGDVDLPVVFYGRITYPAVGYTCVGRFDESGPSDGVVAARLLSPDPDGYVLEAAGPGEHGPPHYLSPGGSRIGEEPLDAPSGPIYRFCKALAGIERNESVYGIDLLVTFDGSLHSDDVTVYFHSGLDRIGVSGGSFEGEEAVSIPLRVTPAVSDLEVQVETPAGPAFSGSLRWPIEFRRIIASGEPCGENTTVEVSVGSGFVDGSAGEESIELRFVKSACTNGDESPTTSGPPPEDPWKITTIGAEDYEGADLAYGVEEILRADSLIEATIVTLGNPQDGGRRCCENPPFTVTDVDLIGGSPLSNGGNLNGVGYVDLPEFVEPGDRVTMLLSGDTIALFVFGPDGGLIHPVPAHQAAAIDAIRAREAVGSGHETSSAISPLDAVRAVWSRYRDPWWGTIEHRTDLVLSGVPGFSVTCSAADMGPLVEMYPYPAASEGLPDAVADAREQLIEAAVSCDFDTILALVRDPAYPGDVSAFRDEFWWSATDSLQHFTENDRVYGSLRELVWALAWTAYGAESIEQADGTNATSYRWPADYGSVDAGASFADVVPLDELSRMATLNRMEIDDLATSVEEFGGYAFFRTGIRGDGQWLYALSGD